MRQSFDLGFNYEAQNAPAASKFNNSATSVWADSAPSYQRTKFEQNRPMRG